MALYGTLILGQAIVSANIVSPILVIIVALTGISTFAVPNFALNYSYRILRFVYIFLRFICRIFWNCSWSFYKFFTLIYNYIFWRSLFNSCCTSKAFYHA
ncbi:MAG: spore germination protein [Clostridia bacterium]|nr:spore germination protein [Clostridia bacterium]